MKKILLCLALILNLSFIGWADTDSFKIKPKLYWSTMSPFVIHNFSRVGLTVLSFDGSIFEYKNFSFLSVGIGLQAYQEKVIGWHSYDYYGYRQSWYGEGYEFAFEPYLKFVPVKYHWKWASELLNIGTYLELGITTKKDIVFGVTFSGNPFKKKPQEPEEEEN